MSKDEDIFTFDEDDVVSGNLRIQMIFYSQEEWDAWEELSEDQMKNRLTKIFDRMDTNK